MTIICALSNPEFVIIGSDTQLGDGPAKTRFQGEKLHQVNDAPIVWGLSGNMDLDEHIGQWIDQELPKQLHLDTVSVANLIGDVVVNFNQRSVERAARIRGGGRDSSDAVSLMIGGKFKEGFKIILCDPFGSVPISPSRSMPHRPFSAIGSASVQASTVYGSLEHLIAESLPQVKAELLLARVLATTIEVTEQSVGFPLALWRIDKGGCHQLDEQEIQQLVSRLDRWKQEERASFDRGD